MSENDAKLKAIHAARIAFEMGLGAQGLVEEGLPEGMAIVPNTASRTYDVTFKAEGRALEQVLDIARALRKALTGCAHPASIPCGEGVPGCREDRPRRRRG